MGPLRPREVPEVTSEAAQRVWVRHGSPAQTGSGDAELMTPYGKEGGHEGTLGVGGQIPGPSLDLHPTDPHPGPPQAHCEEVLLLV